MSESLHTRNLSFGAPPSVGTALRVPAPPRGATPFSASIPPDANLADASASVPSIQEQLKARYKLARQRMGAAPVPPRVKLPQPKKNTRHQSPERRLEKVREAMKSETVTIIVTGYWGYNVLSENTGRPTGRQIMREVAAKTGITISEMMSPRRNKHFVNARHLAMWRIRNECPHMSFPQIAKLFNRDHTVALYACRRMDRIMAKKQGAA